MAKISNGRLKATEPTGHGSPKDTGNASQVPFPSVGQSRRDVHTGSYEPPLRVAKEKRVKLSSQRLESLS